jgi:dihydrofolate reductase
VIIYFAAASLDLMLAGPHGQLDWLPQPEAGGEDYGYKAFYDAQDLVVMGRKTYDICLGFGPQAWPYGEKETVVLTRQANLTPKHNERFEAFDAELWRGRSATKKVYLNGGGEAARLFLQHGLIDRLVITTIPTLLGEGLPLFAPGFPRSHWSLQSCRTYPAGFAVMVYNKVVLP